MPRAVHNLVHFTETHVFISSTIIVFFVGGLVTYLADPARRDHGMRLQTLAGHFFPWAHYRSPTIRVDIMFYLAGKFTQGYIILCSTLISAAAAGALMRGLSGCLPAPAHPSYGVPALGLAAAAMFVFGDLGEFTSHIIQHKVKPLWEFHKVHHAATFLTPLTTFRSHPVSNLIDCVMMGLFTAIPAGLAAAFWDFSLHDRLMLSAVVNLALAIGLLGTLQHTHFPVSFGWLERLIVSPLMHQAHHSNKPEHFDRNFGTRLSIWDRCLGTAVFLPKGERVEFGLNAQEDRRGDYRGILWCYVGPFINCAKMLTRKAGGQPASGRTSAPETGLG